MAEEKINGRLVALPLRDKEVTYYIEKETRGQSSSPATWKKHRKGRITASKFKEVCTKIDSLEKKREKISSLIPPHYLQNWCMAVKIWIMSRPSSGEKKMRTKHSVTCLQLLYPSTEIGSWQKVAYVL